MMNDDNIKVLFATTDDIGGGAANAAYRIMQSVNSLQDGVGCRMLVKQKHTQDDSVIPLSDFIPQNALYRTTDWLATKVKNKLQHSEWRHYPDREQVYMSDLRSTRIHGALNRLDYAILHLHWINGRFLPLQAFPTDKPIVWTLHDSWPFCGQCHYFLDCTNYKQQCGDCPFLHSGKMNDLSHQIWKRKYDAYKDLDLHIVCPSQWLADCAAESGLFKDRDIRVIPNCLDTDLFRPANQYDKKKYILFGAINAINDRVKGFSLLTEALQKLDESFLDDYELVVFGADAPDVPIETNIPIRYVGYLQGEQLIRLYQQATAVVIPSITEVFGQTASEAMSCGTPVVAFRCTGIQDVVGNQGGYLAMPYDTDDLARGIKWVIDHNSRGEMRRQVREDAVARFSMSVVARQYVELYKELTQK